MRNGRRRQPVGRRGTREASTRHFATPVIVVDEPRDIAQQATLADDPLAQARPARIAVCDAWDDVDTQPDALLFDTLDTDEVPTLTMRRPQPRAERNPTEASLERSDVGPVDVGPVDVGPVDVGRVIDDHAGADVSSSARRIAKHVS